jgi:hypothetical protein
MTQEPHRATPLDAAVSYADQGIPVLPYQLTGHRRDPDAKAYMCACRRRDCSASPLLEPGRRDPHASARQMTHAARWWTANPDAAIASLTGTAFDMIEIHSTIPPGTILEWLADQHVTLGPVLHAGHGRVQLLTKPDSYQHDRFDSAAAAILYLPAGSLILLPPSRLTDGQPVTWLRPLDTLASLPDGSALFWTLTDLPETRQLSDPAQYAFPRAPQQQRDNRSEW